MTIDHFIALGAVAISLSCLIKGMIEADLVLLALSSILALITDRYITTIRRKGGIDKRGEK